MIRYVCDGCTQDFDGKPDHRINLVAEVLRPRDQARLLGATIVDLCAACVAHLGELPLRSTDDGEIIRKLAEITVRGRPG